MTRMILPGFSGHWKIIRRCRYRKIIMKNFVECLYWIPCIEFEAEARRDVKASK